jgi:regulatory protein
MGDARVSAAIERRARRAVVDDPEIVMEAAAAFLAIRPRSVDETRRRLRQLGYRHVLVDEVVQRLVELGYLDDAAFARAWIESRDRARPRGESALRRELAQKGLSAETIADVLTERGASDAPGGDAAGRGSMAAAGERGAADRAAAGRLIERRQSALHREPDPHKRRQKAYALLARNGFDPEICRDVAGTVAHADGDADS